jgi:hypothetical protein
MKCDIQMSVAGLARERSRAFPAFVQEGLGAHA